MFEGLRPVVMVLFLWLAMAVASVLVLHWRAVQGVPVAAVAAIVLGFTIGLPLYGLARRQSEDAYVLLGRMIAGGEPIAKAIVARAAAEAEERIAAAIAQHREELKRADAVHTASAAKLVRQKEKDLGDLERAHNEFIAEATSRHESELAQLDDYYSMRINNLDQTYRRESERLLAEHTRATAERAERHRVEWSRVTEPWYRGLAYFDSEVQALNTVCDRWFPAWDGEDWQRWLPPREDPPPIRFGAYPLDLARIPDGMPQDERLRPLESVFSVPALTPFPERSLLLLKAGGAVRESALEPIQAVMLRMLTSIPPSKVRFTILDPIGLGESFSAFMHLVDFDDQLVTKRIWTESGHIEQRLVDITEHMETVLQAYLRNEFDSIQQYNASAGEMAEPYRVLVVPDFPANFSEAAARRLMSVVSSGARCGVYTLMSFDPRAPMPRDFHMADLMPHASALDWIGDQFVWTHPDCGPLGLEPDPLPSPELFTAIVRRAGQAAKEAGRVEVPFASIAPEESQWWTDDSRGGIDVPLGRAGAMKFQRLQLGSGTSQHVLISGKTGSGKSTLLHVLVTNVALHYSPSEVHFYLIDFKKGVEFKAYAKLRLPHVRVVAIESEREFGLSVLEQLDVELKNRGDLFRAAGAQEVTSFRHSRPDVPMPRLLLIIDEFQELFVEDDRISQRAVLLLDRLVRQGRAFGIHVFLGSQTLAGAYSLPRSTLGQMAVRIALQCSESDAHLILSEENTAARLLTRPGEAIYNDANGLSEGNHPFQVTWLGDAERDQCLQRLREVKHDVADTFPEAIVFEGNSDADVGENRQLCSLLAASAWPDACPTPRAWIGAPVAIKGPTAITFARQSGSNVLVVGHREEAALGVLAAAMFSLAAQQPPRDGVPWCHILDGAVRDTVAEGFWGRLAPLFPHQVQLASPREAPAAMAQIAEELTRREQSGQEDFPSLYLLIYNMGRFNELRKTDDGYGFGSRDDQPPSTAKQFSRILRDGPAHGIHTLLWCNTNSTLTRWLDRQELHDLEMRILFQMNPTDSSQLIDSPAASQLGPHRAVFYNEGLGELEKFRPYGLPTEEFLAAVAKQFRSRQAAP